LVCRWLGKNFLKRLERLREEVKAVRREPYLRDVDVTIWNGDAITVLRELPDRSVHMVATSPPFYGLRDYGTGTWEGGDESCDHNAGRKSILIELSPEYCKLAANRLAQQSLLA
jgi:DNA modification methylase